MKVQTKIKNKPDHILKPKSQDKQKSPNAIIQDSQALSSPQKPSDHSPMPSQEAAVPPKTETVESKIELKSPDIFQFEMPIQPENVEDLISIPVFKSPLGANEIS